MKILLINSVCGYGSTGNICVEIGKEALRRGYEVSIAYGRGEAKVPNGISTYKICSNFNNKIDGLKTRLFDNQGKNSKKPTRKLIDYIREYNPDIIHLHNLHGYYLNYEILFDYLKNGFKGKVFWTLHDCLSFTGHCSHFENIGCEKWKEGCSKCPLHKEYPSSIVDKSKKMYQYKKECFTNVPNMKLITPSKWLSDLVKESFLKEYDVTVVNNGIDLSVFKPLKSDFKKKYSLGNRIILLGVSFVWGESKGLDVFIELAKRLEEKYEERYQIILVGTNEMIDKEIPRSIISIHRTNSQKELAEIYSASDIFVNPTRGEVFGLVNVEALACGTPVITFKTGGSPETIDSSSGIVVEKNNIDELEQAIYKLTSNSIDSRKCIERARRFDAAKKFSEYVDLYEK